MYEILAVTRAYARVVQGWYKVTDAYCMVTVHVSQ